ncbi:hypothetical protein TC41_2449 [Alicyclobacillus acidocaldarius subsp. acidocaldarius Tc-4-1]|uniref:Uncharacterized protein n=1 Tax=Alicyclobacillus acidocaldarius (strain Tc-4-1) TaxID=1048834 RepID=F8IGZ4_ALIAT|nr:hypothetical protein TC41_2449 [Alicyclobacillus acidocaldarius subsp. acidocaldarius Tc-4-1]
MWWEIRLGVQDKEMKTTLTKICNTNGWMREFEARLRLKRLQEIGTASMTLISEQFAGQWTEWGIKAWSRS